jgi:flagellar motor switch protein FliN/FliY
MNAPSKPSNQAPSPDEAPGPSRPAAHVIATTELEGPRAGGPEAHPAAATPPLVDALADVHHPLRKVKARLTVSVGVAEIPVGDLLSAREQQVLRLDRTLDEPVEVLLEGQVVARGILVAVDDHFAVRITELPAGSGSAPRQP